MNSILLLDIDGVISPLGRIHNDDYVIVNNDYSTWNIPFNAVNLIRNSLDDGHNIIWASAWESVSNHINKELNLDSFDYLTFDNDDALWFKFTSIKNFVKTIPQNIHIVWVDDEIPPEVFEWADNQPNITCIIPNGLTGLSELDIESIESAFDKN